MLLQLRAYLKKENIVSDQQLSREFQVDRTALEPMLQWLMHKGYITRCHQKSACKGGGCFKCEVPPIYYQYQD